MQRVWSAYYDDTPEQSSRPTSITSSPSPQHYDVEPAELTPQFSYAPATSSNLNMLSPESDLLPPRPPFAHPLSRTQSSPKSLRSLSETTSLNPPPSFNPLGKEIDKDVSLSINYFPLKFSSPRNTGIYNRKRKELDEAFELEIDAQIGLPKRGGGRNAFREGEARMAGVGDEADEQDDTEGADAAAPTNRKNKKLFPARTGVPHIKRRLRWNLFKWCLFIANAIHTTYALGALVVCLLTWFNIFPKADVIRVANRPELIVSTAAAGIAVIASVIGWSGILLNSRPFLAIYTLLLWVTFMFVLTPGYITYKRREFNLEGKLNAQWSTGIGTIGRLRIQNQLDCCGYFSPFVEATVSQSCYSRSILPGCKGPYLAFQRMILEIWYEAAFALVAPELVIFVVALLCSNHITYRFGKGMMPKAYRLEWKSVAMILDSYASQLADIYGEDAIRSTRQKFDMDSKSQREIPKSPYDSAPASPSASTTLAALPYNGVSTYSSAYMFSNSGVTQRKYGAVNTAESPQEWDPSKTAESLYVPSAAHESNDALIHGAGKPIRDVSSNLARSSEPPEYRRDGKF